MALDSLSETGSLEPVRFWLQVMNQTVSTKDPASVAREVQASYLAMFPQGNPLFVPGAFASASECFTGRYADYQAVDTDYHDFEHTLQGTLCMVRILHGRQKAAAKPPITQRNFELGLLRSEERR